MKVVSQTDSGEMRIIDLSTKKATSLGVGWMPRYLPNGYLIFARGGSLQAVAGDIKHGELTGSPIPILENVGASPWFDVQGGTLALSTSGRAVGGLIPVIVSKDGR